MYQIASAIIRDTGDSTKVHLLFANRTEYDILLVNELDSLAAHHPDRFYIYHILSRPKNQTAWDETGHFTGYVSEEVLAQIFPRGGKTVTLSVCVFHDRVINCIINQLLGKFNKNMALLCGPKGFTEDTCPKSLKALGYTDSTIVTF